MWKQSGTCSRAHVGIDKAVVTNHWAVLHRCNPRIYDDEFQIIIIWRQRRSTEMALRSRKSFIIQRLS